MIAALNRSHLSLSSAVFAAVFLTQFSGCGKGEKLPSTYAVSGTVLYKDKPVEGATVVFRNTEGERTHIATGVTDANGHFDLISFGDKPGAVAGTHNVTVSKVTSDQQAASSLSMEEAAAQQSTPEPKAKHELPLKYADPNTSDLKADVKAEDGNEVKLDLMD